MLHQNHMGIVKTKMLARSYVWWPEIDRDIESITKVCQACCKYRDSPQKATLISWEWPKTPWERMHVDFYVLIIIRVFLY